ncbi:MAG: 5'-deoxynucleotidase [Spartobacteria bacterium]|nr:5'-deoxynucleotidase [Spartobacteria bacterium]
MSHFFAYMSRMKFIQRWGLMRNTLTENIQEHSLQVAMVGHMLAVIRNKKFDGQVDPSRVVLLAMYHDCSEVITGDLATPIKCFNPQINEAYKNIEQLAADRILKMIPEELRDEYQSLFFSEGDDEEVHKIVKAADKLCAYLKCLEELQAGNSGFLKAERTIMASLMKMNMPEVTYFVEVFTPSFSLTLDELN